ncbi:MAG: hypothetical protein COW84_08825 [Gammaproteobacteria bacterium CG22_combo_CG10-13_8_21_14_all_40_8]|nr:MAG: hypothetical protein COW84_08825 [Gammaproteobacteria bacterium CG22_combo_CG10-13_8_21_14_all_40_8]
MILPTLKDIESAAKIVYETMPATPQYSWPLLNTLMGCETWVKHENHTPVGAFKLRGGLVYFSHLSQLPNKPLGVVSATRGNHGQSVGLAAAKYQIPATIVVPKGNSVEKNSAMKALGVELIEMGEDFQESLEYAQQLAEQRDWHLVPSFDRQLLSGVSSYCLELLNAVEALDKVYVPIGLGSGICSMIATRNALNLKTQIIGVVSTKARAYAESFLQGHKVESPVSTKIADGMACRTPNQEALEIILQGVDHVVEVSDEEVCAAIEAIYQCTHNLSEGAGAAATAAALQEKALNKNKKIAVVLTGGNIDQSLFQQVLSHDPQFNELN